MDVRADKFTGKIAQYAGDFLMLRLRATTKPENPIFNIIMLVEETDDNYMELYETRHAAAKKYNLPISLIILNKRGIGKIPNILQMIYKIKKYKSHKCLSLSLPSCCNRIANIIWKIAYELNMNCTIRSSEQTSISQKNYPTYLSFNTDITIFANPSIESLDNSMFLQSRSVYYQVCVETPTVNNIIGKDSIAHFLYDTTYTLLYFPCPHTLINIEYTSWDGVTHVSTITPSEYITHESSNEYESIYYRGFFAASYLSNMPLVAYMWRPDYYRRLLELYLSNISYRGTYFAIAPRDILVHLLNYINLEYNWTK